MKDPFENLFFEQFFFNEIINNLKNFIESIIVFFLFSVFIRKSP